MVQHCTCSINIWTCKCTPAEKNTINSQHKDIMEGEAGGDLVSFPGHAEPYSMWPRKKVMGNLTLCISARRRKCHQPYLMLDRQDCSCQCSQPTDVEECSNTERKLRTPHHKAQKNVRRLRNYIRKFKNIMLGVSENHVRILIISGKRKSCQDT